MPDSSDGQILESVTGDERLNGASRTAAPNTGEAIGPTAAAVVNVEPTEADRTDAPAGFGTELIAGAIGCAVAMLCLLPPILHFITGPLGPLIGGFIASKRLPRGGRRGVVVLMIGGGVTAAVGGAALLISRHDAPSWMPSADALTFILFGVFIYAAGLSAVGAALAKVIGDSKASASPEDA
jgi:hypothetical protein